MKNIDKILKSIPKSPGVYQFYDKSGQVIYIGKSVLLRTRVASYFKNKNLGPKTKLLTEKTAKIKYIKVFSEFEALLLESDLIQKNQPFFNIISKDDKSPIYIKITNDKIPTVALTRREKPKAGVFIKGPFPSTRTTKDILKMTRKIFPYCQHKNPKKACLFVHLGLCPYPYKDENSQKEYLKTIVKIKKLLSGRTRKLVSDLTLEMKTYSKNQQYEKAAAVKEQIQKLQYLTSIFRTPSEFLEKPSLVDDLAATRLKDLKDKLGLKNIPKRIECYDISSFHGKLATGSMVVFQNGQPAKSEYRKFKIKFTSEPNDYQMIKEVLARRFKNSWPNPDLIIIDGGRGHLNAALTVVGKLTYKIPIVSLAKKFEEIYAASRPNPISLTKESPARQLAQAIRDEAHRFAITYHRLLRSKAFIHLSPS